MEKYKTKLCEINQKLIEEMEIAVLKDEPVVQEAAELIKAGELVAFPTETVYGLGADATNPEAVKKIYLAKGRPQDNPLIVHIASYQQLKKVIRGELNSLGEKLTSFFWPGPLTIIVNKSELIPDATTAGSDSVAVRMPAHPLIRALIERANLPIAAPSANKSGAPSPTRASHVFDDLKGEIPLILDGGAAQVGLESTVIDIRDNNVKILRPGGISREEIERLLDYSLDQPHTTGRQSQIEKYSAGKDDKPLAPGMKYRHYSPETLLYIIENQQMLEKVLARYDNNSHDTKSIALILSDESIQKYQRSLEGFQLIKMGSQKEPAAIAANIFDCLRKLDKMSLTAAYIEAIPEKGIGEAVMNRLYKASARE